MADYVTILTTRGSIPDPVALAAGVKTATGDATAVLVQITSNSWRGKKASPWTAAQIAAAQNLVDTTPEVTPELEAQRIIDAMPLWEKAAFLLILDRLNLLGARVNPVVNAVTPQQFLQAIRDKAATL